MNIKKIEKANKVLSILRICLVIVLLVLIGCNVVHEWIGVTHSLFLYEVEDEFKKHILDFDTLAKTFSEKFKNEYEKNKNLKYMYVKESNGKLHFNYIYKFGESSKEIEIDEPMDTKLEQCFDSLKKNVLTPDKYRKGFWRISVTKEQICFQTGSSYSIIYSRKRPSYKDYEYDYFVDRIGFNWYQVLLK